MTAKWLGRCPACSTWESFLEELGTRRGAVREHTTAPEPLHTVETAPEPRLVTGISELDRLLGGGITRGSTILVAGEPGAGKSTLLTELGSRLHPLCVLYVTGEESVQQVRMRADRLGAVTENTLLFAETNLDAIVEAAHDTKPDVVVVDSIQTVYRPDVESAPGSVTQIRECTAAILRLTRQIQSAAFLVGHVTRSGSIAGPRVMEHLVDTVLYFEGDQRAGYRILRAVKNRFGSTNEIGVFEMGQRGLTPVENPSALFLVGHGGGCSGSSVASVLQGSRPVLVEVQALVASSSYSTPQRTSSGFDLRRLQLLLAVLEKREGLSFAGQDVFLKVAGGVNLSDPAADLAVVVALASSLLETPAHKLGVPVGEVGLGGEVRHVSRLDIRLKEVAQMGFKHAVVPNSNYKTGAIPADLEIIRADTTGPVLDMLG